MKLKVKCVGYAIQAPWVVEYFTIGKVYRWKDGILIGDNGHKAFWTETIGADPKKWKIQNRYLFEIVNKEKIATKIIKLFRKNKENLVLR